MPEDGSSRPRIGARRLLLALARAAALFILVTGIYGAVTIGLPQVALQNRAIGSILLGVVTYELLRRPRRTVAPAAADPPADPIVIDNSAELLEAQQAIDRLKLEAQNARDREAQTREQYERQNEQLQGAAGRALEEIQRIRAANDELRGRADAQSVAADQLRARIEAERKANDELRSALDKERKRAAAFELQHVESEKRVNAVAAQHAEAEKRAAATAQELEAMRAERQRARRDVEEAKQRAEVEKAAQRKTLEAESAAKLRDAQRELDLTRSSAKQLLQANETLSRQLDEERQRLQAELQRTITESKSERDEMQAEARLVAARMQELMSQLDRERELSRQMTSTRAALDEENASLKKGRDELTRSLAERDENIARAGRDHASELQQKETAWSEKLQKIVAGLTTDHENDLGEAIAAREQARAEVRSLHQRIADLEEQNERLKGQLDAAMTPPAPAVDEQALREAIDAEWSEKLQKIVTGLTTDHENDLGDAISAREAARAEARSLNQRIARIEQQNEQLKEQLEAAVTPPPAAVDEQSPRESIDAEWSEKLQKIVNGLAMDHEADIGKAIEEREAARAELRNVNIKITSLQQKLEAERQARESLQMRLRETEEQMRNAPTQPMAAIHEPFPAETNAAPHEEQRARADVLQFAEQAYEAIRRATSPGTVPVPAPQTEKRPRVLIVHHDPRFRSMWRDFLDKSGFDVQMAADGAEGWRIVQGDRPGAVIADMAMPKMDGRELCRLIKSNPETAGVKVILLSGMYTSEMPLDAAGKDIEADEILRKPVKPEAMKNALTNLLAVRAAG